MALASDLGMRLLLAHGALGLGTLYNRTGQREPGRALLAAALALFDAMGMTPWRARAETALAQLA
jgi:hypothetical protein